MRMRRFAIFLLAATVVYGILWIGIANPFNFFVPRSDNFSMRRFSTIKPGSSMADAINLLGKPLKVVKEDRFDPGCLACSEYCFMGEPPRWVIGFREAWLIADKQGKIVRVFVHTEP